MSCDYCEGGLLLDLTYLDVSAFSESVEAYIEDDRLVIEKYDGDLRIKAKYCLMCGAELKAVKR